VPRCLEFCQKKEHLRPGMRGRTAWVAADLLDSPAGEGAPLAGRNFDVLFDCATFHG
jgi:hypothetical protein